MCATSIGSTFSHSPVPGERKSGIPDGTEIPAPVRATTEPASRTRPASVAAPVPSDPSTAACACPGTPRCPRGRPRWRTRRRSRPSRPRCPRRGRPCAETSLICATASGAWPASLRAQASAVSSSSWSAHDAVDQAELEGLLGADRVADQVHLQRLVGAHQARQALGAAEAGDDAELDLGLAEDGRARGDPHVAGHRQLAAAAEGEAVDRGDRGDARGRPGRAAARGRCRCSSRAAGLVHLRERLDVGARRRTAAGWRRR